MKIGDLVKGISDKYGFTNTDMTKGVVTRVDGESITVRILEHKVGNTGKYDVEARYFEVIGEVKPFDRDAVFELLKSGNKSGILEYDLTRANLTDADLRGADLTRANLTRAYLTDADLRGADLRGADLDFSCLPLWCGSLLANMDDRQVKQLLYHTLSIVKHSNNVSELLKEKLLTESNLEVAKEFHRADECDKL